MLKLHVAGDWPEDSVRTTRVASTHFVPAEVEQIVDRAWKEALARPGVHLFDGPMCRHESWRVEGAMSSRSSSLHLSLSTTSYRWFLGTNLAHPELADRFGANVLANPVGVSPALLSSDGFLVFGVRNGRVAYHPNRVHPFAGAVEPKDDLNLFEAVRRELREELSFNPAEDIAEIRCTGIAEDLALRQPEIIFRVTSRRARQEIVQRIDEAEHGASWAVRAEAGAVEAAMRDARLTPVAVASLALWGRGAFGDEWFERSCRWPADGDGGGGGDGAWT